MDTAHRFPTDSVALRKHNLSSVLRALRDRGPQSRAQIAAGIGLNKATVSSLVAELAERGLVGVGEAVRGQIGRPGQAIALTGHQVCGIGAEVNVHHIAVVALDLSGEVVGRRREDIDSAASSPQLVLAELGDLAQSLSQELIEQGITPIATTVGIAGLVGADHATLTVGPNLGWHDVPVRDLLAHTSDSVEIDNEANLAALAEASVRGDSPNLVVLFGEVGVGGGIVTEGRLLRGEHGHAGEVGHVVVDPEGRPCGCGRIGCLETVAGLRALVALASAPDDHLRDPSLRLEERLAEIERRARAGDPRTLDALAMIGDWLGRGIALLVKVLDPGVVVLSGYYSRLGTWMVPALNARLEQDRQGSEEYLPTIELSQLGFDAAVRGAATAALEHIYADPTVVPRVGAAQLEEVR